MSASILPTAQWSKYSDDVLFDESALYRMCSSTAGLSESDMFESAPFEFWTAKMNSNVTDIAVRTVSPNRHPCYVDQTTWPQPDVVLTFDSYSNSLSDMIKKMNLSHVCMVLTKMMIYAQIQLRFNHLMLLG